MCDGFYPCSTAYRKKILVTGKNKKNPYMNKNTILGRSLEALGGKPAPSTIQGYSGLPLFCTALVSEVII